MRLLRSFLHALRPAQRPAGQPRLADAAGTVDIYVLERRREEHARTRMVLYASGVGR